MNIKLVDEEYYQFYLSKHQNPKNRLLHLFGNLMTVAYIVTVILCLSWFWLLLAPFIVYPFAITGHFIFKDNKPALFSSNPIKAKLADIQMCLDVLCGKL
jgi:hypothetical protein